MQRLSSFGLTLALFALVACSTAPETATDKRVQDAEVHATIEKFKARQPAVDVYLENAYAYAVFPEVGKAGIGIGGALGRGQVFKGGSLVGYAKLKAASIGFQFGGQAFAQMVFIQNESAFQNFTSGEFGFDANASAVAATAGAAAKAEFEDGMAVFVMSEAGLMYEASIGGQKFEYEAAK